jgi:Kef-type K+ transport system membrane component KefB
MEFRDLLLGLVLVWLAAKAASEGMQRIGQTAVLGELLAGVIIGPSWGSCTSRRCSTPWLNSAF